MVKLAIPPNKLKYHQINLNLEHLNYNLPKTTEVQSIKLKVTKKID